MWTTEVAQGGVWVTKYLGASRRLALAVADVYLWKGELVRSYRTTDRARA